jgi:hypothetical protein
VGHLLHLSWACTHILDGFLLEPQHHRAVLINAAGIFSAGRHAADVVTGGVRDLRAPENGSKVAEGVRSNVLSVKGQHVSAATGQVAQFARLPRAR